MAGEEGKDGLDELRSELGSDEYPLPGKRDEKKQVTYKDVDVTITLKKDSKKAVESDEKRTLFTDDGLELGALDYNEATGILRVPIVLAKEMVYHYEDYDAFRPKEELKAVSEYIKGVPVTRGHPEARIVTDRGQVLGWAGDAEFEDDELRVVLEIADKDLVADVRSGKLRGVSPGHFSRLDRSADGEFEGAHYDLTQRDIFIDHIAIVEEGRCSTADGCGVALDEELGSGGKKKEEDEGEVMEPKVVANKVDAAITVAEKIEEKAEEGKDILTKIAEVKDVPAAAVALVKKAVGIAEKIEAEAKDKLVGSLEKVKEAVTGMKEEEEKEEGKDTKGDAVNDEAMKKVVGERDTLKTERDTLKVELDAIVDAEKVKIIDELKTLQDVKDETVLKEMSLDGLKSDLELVKALKGTKFVVDDKGGSGDAGAIRKAYESVGKKGGKE